MVGGEGGEERKRKAGKTQLWVLLKSITRERQKGTECCLFLAKKHTGSQPQARRRLCDKHSRWRKHFPRQRHCDCRARLMGRDGIKGCAWHHLPRSPHRAGRASPETCPRASPPHREAGGVRACTHTHTHARAHARTALLKSFQQGLKPKR